MAELYPDGMSIIPVEPCNYDRIIEESQGTKEPYTLEDLQRIRSHAKARNTVALVMIMQPDYWSQGRE